MTMKLWSMDQTFQMFHLSMSQYLQFIPLSIQRPAHTPTGELMLQAVCIVMVINSFINYSIPGLQPIQDSHGIFSPPRRLHPITSMGFQPSVLYKLVTLIKECDRGSSPSAQSINNSPMVYFLVLPLHYGPLRLHI